MLPSLMPARSDAQHRRRRQLRIRIARDHRPLDETQPRIRDDRPRVVVELAVGRAEERGTIAVLRCQEVDRPHDLDPLAGDVQRRQVTVTLPVRAELEERYGEQLPHLGVMGRDPAPGGEERRGHVLRFEEVDERPIPARTLQHRTEVEGERDRVAAVRSAAQHRGQRLRRTRGQRGSEQRERQHGREESRSHGAVLRRRGAMRNLAAGLNGPPAAYKQTSWGRAPTV